MRRSCRFWRLWSNRAHRLTRPYGGAQANRSQVGLVEMTWGGWWLASRKTEEFLNSSSLAPVSAFRANRMGYRIPHRLQIYLWSANYTKVLQLLPWTCPTIWNFSGFSTSTRPEHMLCRIFPDNQALLNFLMNSRSLQNQTNKSLLHTAVFYSSVEDPRASTRDAYAGTVRNCSSVSRSHFRKVIHVWPCLVCFSLRNLTSWLEFPC